MRRYEVVFVLAPTLGEEEVKQQIETFSTVAQEKGAEVLEVEELGKRRLAYPIEKFTDGIYVIFYLEEEAGVAVTELERRFRVVDAVIRFLTIRVDEALERAEKFKKRREARKERRAATRQKKAAAAEAEAPAPEVKAEETVAEAKSEEPAPAAEEEETSEAEAEAASGEEEAEPAEEAEKAGKKAEKAAAKAEE